jgi:uncharacterized protein (TIGR00369 family)
VSTSVIEPTPDFFYSEPEVLFRINELSASAEGVRSSMVSGEWMLSPTGDASRGSLSVLLDVVLGIATLTERPHGRWGVTVELSVDFCADPPLTGEDISGEASIIENDQDGGLARGSLQDAAGTLLAVATARLRYSDRLPVALADDGAIVIPHFERSEPPRSVPTAELIGAILPPASGSNDTLLLPASPLNLNPAHTVHGGILACATELLGLTVARAANPDFITTSLRIAFLRAPRAGQALTFTAVVKHPGRALQVIEVTARDDRGKACSVGTVTCLARSADAGQRLSASGIDE